MVDLQSSCTIEMVGVVNLLENRFIFYFTSSIMINDVIVTNNYVILQIRIVSIGSERQLVVLEVSDHISIFNSIFLCIKWLH